MKLTPIEYIGAAPVRKKRRAPLGGWLLLAFALVVGVSFIRPFFLKAQSAEVSDQNLSAAITRLEATGNFGDQLASEALKRTTKDITYDSSYYKIDFPNGDIPSERGKDVDVVIRSYRALEIDLQLILHEEYFRAFSQLPAAFRKQRTG